MKAMSFDQIKSGATDLNALPSTKIISSLSTDRSFMDHFYLTGYEGLCLSLNHKDLTRAIISSAVPMEGELLVVGSGEACDTWRHVCAELRIRISAIDIDETEFIEAAEAIFKANKHITHLLCTTQCSAEHIKLLGKLAHSHRCALIVDNSADDMSMADIEESGVDFAIAASDSEQPVSVIVARRSRLVMTEGNARNAEHDIYAIWQSSLSSRNSTWVPMA